MQQVCGVTCSVLGCSSNYDSTDQQGEKIRFFNFPSRPYDVQRRHRWIANIRKARLDTEGVWTPTKYSKVCSRHFVDNIKGEDPRAENYAPTIFPFVKRETAEKYNRLLAKRRKAKESQQKLTEASETPSFAGVSKHPLPSSNAATAQAAGGATMEGQSSANFLRGWTTGAAGSAACKPETHSYDVETWKDANRAQMLPVLKERLGHYTLTIAHASALPASAVGLLLLQQFQGDVRRLR